MLHTIADGLLGGAGTAPVNRLNGQRIAYIGDMLVQHATEISRLPDKGQIVLRRVMAT
jgi:hypothetical protein